MRRDRGGLTGTNMNGDMQLGDLNTIGDVTQTLVNLLQGLDITLDSPAQLPTASTGGESFSRVNLYLYQVSENPYTKNQPWTTRTGGAQEYPPLSLNLYYLLTPFASDAISAQQVLTHAMQLLYVNSIVSDDQLSDSLRLTSSQLSINLCQMSLEELTRVWNALQTPYRLSVSYEVRVVLIESMIQTQPVRAEVMTHVVGQK